MKKIFLPATILMLALYGCQPETPKQPVAPAAPAVTMAAPAASAPAAMQMAAPAAAASTGAGDAAIRALAQKSGCFACHAIDKKVIGPAWNEVAAKYRGQKDAEGKLVDKVAKGGSGVWGAVAMPPNAPRVSAEDMHSLVRYILSLQ